MYLTEEDFEHGYYVAIDGRQPQVISNNSRLYLINHTAVLLDYMHNNLQCDVSIIESKESRRLGFRAAMFKLADELPRGPYYPISIANLFPVW
jgi:hypothetical protein